MPRCASHKLYSRMGKMPMPRLRPPNRCSMTISWRGVFPAVTTFFRDDQSLDIPATLRHVDRLLASAAHGLIMLGTVGENCSLEPGEKRELLGATVGHVAGR